MKLHTYQNNLPPITFIDIEKHRNAKLISGSRLLSTSKIWATRVEMLTKNCATVDVKAKVSTIPRRVLSVSVEEFLLLECS